MSRILYFDCFSGMAGDMVLGALLDAGLPFEDLKRALGSLALEGVSVSAERVLRAGVSATKFSVHGPQLSAVSSPLSAVSSRLSALGPQPSAPSPQPSALSPVASHSHDHGHGHDHGHSHPIAEQTGASAPYRHEHRSLPEIFRLIDTSALSSDGRDRAKALFQRLAEVEASIHQMPVEKIHLHEVGAIDSIVDIVGAVFALEWAGADRIICSPLNVGSGMVDSAHGHFPVPAPATLKLLAEHQAPIYSGVVKQELVTPTGALIATSYASSFGAIPRMAVERVGYGAGDRNPPETPNVLRVLIGQAAETSEVDRTQSGRVVVIECEIDDMNPQLFGVVMDRLYAAGALEVFYVPVQMKKNRPGTLLTVIGSPDLRATLAGIIFRETTTIGVRYAELDRECLQRDIVTVETPVGRVRFKLARRDGAVVNAVPEFDDCAKIAATTHLPVKEIQAIATQAYRADRALPQVDSPEHRLRTENRQS